MPRLELLAFFRENTRDLPQTTFDWFQLPNAGQQMIAKLGGAEEVRRRIFAGENVNDLFRITPRVTPEADKFLDGFVTGLNGLIRWRREEAAIHYATTRLVLVTDQFSGDQLALVRKKIFEGRGVAQGQLVERGGFRGLPFANKLRAFCGLSFAADFMRADLESGFITDRAKSLAQGFGYADMEVLERKALERWVGRRVEVLAPDSEGALSPTRKISIPEDAEIRAIQQTILAKLIPDQPSPELS